MSQPSLLVGLGRGREELLPLPLPPPPAVCLHRDGQRIPIVPGSPVPSLGVDRYGTLHLPGLPTPQVPWLGGGGGGGSSPPLPFPVLVEGGGSWGVIGATPIARPNPSSLWSRGVSPTLVRAIGRGRGRVELSRPPRPNFCQGFPPKGEFLARPWPNFL